MTDDAPSHDPLCSWCDQPIDDPYGEDFCSRSCFMKDYWQEERGGPKTCEYCDEEIRGDDIADQKYCSHSCYVEDQRGEERPERQNREERECEYCGDIFQAVPSSEKRFCGYSCSNKHAWESGERDSSHLEESVTVECDWCGEEFQTTVRGKQARFCSNSCTSKYHREKKKTSERECMECGESFMVDPDGGQVFCSRECGGRYAGRNNGDPPQPRECQECGAEFYPSDNSSSQKYCGRECAYESLRAERYEKNCHACGAEFEVRPSRREEAKYCSDECRLQGTSRNLGNKRRAPCGHEVKSEMERQVCAWFHENRIYHVYEPESPAGHADWLIGENTYVELWGGLGDFEDYNEETYAERRERKRAAYDEADVELIELESKDLDNLNEALPTNP